MSSGQFEYVDLLAFYLVIDVGEGADQPDLAYPPLSMQYLQSVLYGKPSHSWPFSMDQDAVEIHHFIVKGYPGHLCVALSLINTISTSIP